MFNNLLIERESPVLDITNMATEAKNPRIYDALLAVKPADITFNAWAVKAGVSRSIFTEIRRHGNPTADTLERLLNAIGVSHAQFNAGMARVRSEVAGAGLVGTHEISREFHGETPLPPLPLVGSALGGEFEDLDQHVEMTELHLNEVLEYLARPRSLASDKDAYALTIVGDSMWPRFRPGRRIVVSPRSALGIGDDVVVQLRGMDGEEERIKLVLIKELVRRTSSHVELRQFNPDVTFRIDARRVASMHKVVGELF